MLEQQVADVMTEGVVDALEAIQIEEHDGHALLVALGLGQGLIETVEQQAAVGQAGQGVVVGHMPDALLGLQAFIDLGLELLVGARQLRGALFDALLQFIVRP